MSDCRTGLTIIELVVVLTLLGLMASVAAFSMPTAKKSVDPSEIVRGAQRDAIKQGQEMTVRARLRDSSFDVTALPDGSVVADSGLLHELLNESKRTDGHR
jgi:prepilin-type N-terminal cleavage/methylation domain-containing protein